MGAIMWSGEWFPSTRSGPASGALASLPVLPAAFILGLLVAEASVLAGVYRGREVISCSAVALEALCAGLRSAPGIGMAVLVATLLYFTLDRAARDDLLARLGHAPRRRVGVALNLAGLGVALIPGVIWSDAMLIARFDAVLALLGSGALLMLAGAARALLGGADWLGWMRASRGRFPLALVAGVVLALAVAVPARHLALSLLTDASFFASTLLLLAIGQPVTTNIDARIVGIDAFHVDIIATCSGFEGLLLTLGFAGLLAIMRRGEIRPLRYWLVLVPAALLMSWTLNVVRIAGLVLIGAYVSPAHALQGFHTYAGWTGFLLTALALMWASRWGLRARAPGPAARPRDGTRAAAADGSVTQILPILALLSATLLASLIWPVPADGFVPIAAATGLALLPAARLWLRAPVLPGVPAMLAGPATGIAWVLFLPPEARPSVSAGAVPWVLGAVLVLPAAQELFFRGYLIARAGASMPLRVAAVLLGAVVFGALQTHWIAGALAGLVFGGLVLRSGRTADAVGAHVLAQAVLAGVVLA